MFVKLHYIVTQHAWYGTGTPGKLLNCMWSKRDIEFPNTVILNIYIYVCVCVHIYTHIYYIYVYTHTYTHTHIYKGRIPALVDTHQFFILFYSS